MDDILNLFQDNEMIEKYFNPNIGALMNMITKSIFLSLSNNNLVNIDLNIKETESKKLIQEFDNNWFYLKKIYTIFYNLLDNEKINLKLLKSYITQKFLNELIKLFNSSNLKERQYLKFIFHEIYSKIPTRRKIIRKVINDYLLLIINEKINCDGIDQLLEFIESIIGGYNIPLRQEHINFFKTILIPLHQIETSHVFIDRLYRCVNIFLKKDNSLIVFLISEILKYWPLENSKKEKLFLEEINKYFEFCQNDELSIPIFIKLFKRIANCLTETHSDIFICAMNFFENQNFIKIVINKKDISYGIFVPIINYLASNIKFSEQSNFNFKKVKNILLKFDKELYKSALFYIEKNKYNKIFRFSAPINEKESIEKKWIEFIDVSKENNKKFNESILSFDENIVI